ncbi:MAG: double-strand break repair helicase AddA [Pseudomonadota bacterium]
MTRITDASEAQLRAAKPGRSTWVSANAGSGKTRVLTNRVARLLLRGTLPERILCLTFTKAAASEMQNRLYQSLGAWAMLNDDKLIGELSKLGEKVTSADLPAARRLFASAIEAPGGLKIQTIHSFCDRLLRQFPLEAGVPAQFETLDERTAAELHEDVLNKMALGEEAHVLRDAIGLVRQEDLSAFIRPILSNPSSAIALQNRASVMPPAYPLFDANDRDFLKELALKLTSGSDTDKKNLPKLHRLLAAENRVEEIAAMTALFLTGETTKTPFGPNAFVTQKVLKKDDPARTHLEDLKARAQDARDQYAAHLNAQRERALGRFASEFLEELAREKLQRGVLEFSDLIERSRNLLKRSSMAEWVLYKLDGGIDHILVDEAQDTSRAQWDIIEALTQDTLSQESDPDKNSLFVVGDEKQSIYSFQGASPDAFKDMGALFARKLSAAGQDLFTQGLLHSFRSSASILNLVDEVTKGDASLGLADTTEHIAAFADKPGRVDLWPYREKDEKAEPPPWYLPVDMPAASDPTIQLASEMADHIADLCSGRHALEIVEDGQKTSRAIQPGDILVLVQKRGLLFKRLIEELKSRAVPISGSDRMRISEELAVKDILSLLRFLTLDADDLSLAEVLRSPLCGLSEADLFKLAHNRKGTLIAALRESASYAECLTFLQDMQSQTDFKRPYELIEHCLIQHRGREKFLSRLGLECEDALDELLAQALAFERSTTPDLTRFIHWFDTGDVDIKRDLDSTRNEVRVMTVHGSKGLESPIVILPDTGPSRARDQAELKTLRDGSLIWKEREALQHRPHLVDIAELNAADTRERIRLLYVALTRAESWLIIAGAGTRPKTRSQPYWYELIETAFEAFDTLTLDKGIKRIADGVWPDAVSITLDNEGPEKVLPDYIQRRAPSLEQPVKPLTPSRVKGAKTLPGTQSDEEATDRGTALHQLLEVLPNLGPDDRMAAAETLFPDMAGLRDLVSHANRLIAHPDLSTLFETGLREVGFSTQFMGQNLRGSFDLLILGEHLVKIVDFKSNKIAPDSISEIPDGLLGQLALYHHAAAEVFPDKTIEAYILWTETEVLMQIPETVITQVVSNISFA